MWWGLVKVKEDRDGKGPSTQPPIIFPSPSESSHPGVALGILDMLANGVEDCNAKSQGCIPNGYPSLSFSRCVYSYMRN